MPCWQEQVVLTFSWATTSVCHPPADRRGPTWHAAVQPHQGSSLALQLPLSELYTPSCSHSVSILPHSIMLSFPDRTLIAVFPPPVSPNLSQPGITMKEKGKVIVSRAKGGCYREDANN